MKVARHTFRHRPRATVVAALLLAACSDGKSDNAADLGQVSAVPDSGRMMAGMEGMPGMGGNGMMEQMQAHLRTMDGASADSLQAMMPTHRQMVTNMLAQFDTDMRGRGMTSDTAWNATADALRQDLARMPGMNGSALHQFMPAHGARLRRLMESHRTMMGTMKR